MLPPWQVNRLLFQYMSCFEVPLSHSRPPKLLSVKLSKSLTREWKKVKSVSLGVLLWGFHIRRPHTFWIVFTLFPLFGLKIYRAGQKSGPEVA